MRACTLVLGLIATAGWAGAAPDLRTVEHLDLTRYMGRWYVISHIPNYLEKNKYATFDDYSLRPDGRLDGAYVFRRGSVEAPQHAWHATASVTDPASNAVWRIRLIWPFSSGYRVLELDPHYQWAAVCSDGASLLWVMSRTPTLPEPVYRQILARLSVRGLDVNKLEKVPQLDTLN